MNQKKYYQIYQDIKKAIQDGTFPEGSLLPSENSLTNQYKVSRDTIRKSLTLLSQDGWIQKKQGLGSIVLTPRFFDFPISGLTSFKELVEIQQMNARTIVLTNKKITVDEKLSTIIDLPVGEKVIFIERIREIDGQKVIFDTDYLINMAVDSIPDDQLKDSLYAYLETELGMPIAFAHKEIYVENITERDRQYLDLREEDNHLVVVRSRVYLENTTYFEHSESRHRVDKFRFIDFSRRKHNLY